MKTKKKEQEIKKSERATKVYNKLPVKVSRKEFNQYELISSFDRQASKPKSVARHKDSRESVLAAR